MRLLAILLVLALPVSGQVAILDTGVDADHPELSGRVTRVSYISVAPLPGVDPGQLEDDPDGHGTATASIVAGATLGVAPQAEILDAQVDDKYAPGVDRNAELAAIQALDDILQNPVDVVVLSFAAAGVSTDGASTLAAQAEKLWDAGVAVVVPRASQSSALHASSRVLTVGEEQACQNVVPAVKPDLVAAATGLTVAAPGNPAQPSPQATASGSHLAAAKVAGALMLLKEAHPDMPVDAMYAILRDSADDMHEPGPDSCSGFGLLNVERAMTTADAWLDPLEPQPTQESPFPAAILVLLAAFAWRRRWT